MNWKKLTSVNLRRSSLCYILALFGATALHAQRISYTVTDLGSLEGPGGSSFATGINNRGAVAATSLPPGGTEAFVWLRGNVTPLITLGGLFSQASGINAGGQVAGRADALGDFVHRATLWENASPTDLGTLGGTNSEASSINNTSQIVGDAETGISDGFGAISHAFLFESGIMHDLLTLGGDNSFAFHINDQGQATGQSDTTISLDPHFGIPNFHGFIAQRNGSLTDLGELFGGKFNYGNGINNLGQIVGSADLLGDEEAHAFTWQSGSVQDLRTLPGDTSSGAFSNNVRGQAVGISALADTSFGPPVNTFLCPCHAVLWERGQILDLSSRIPANSGWQLFIATAINDDGQIIGQGILNNGPLHAFLLTPRNENLVSPNQANTATVNGEAISGSNKLQPAGLVVRRQRNGHLVIEHR